MENVGNYRPICSLPSLYKLFTTILYRRLYPRLDQKQAEDQAGFRSSYQTTDHLTTYRMIEQKCHEWRIKMWTALIDFTKAFDSIAHKSIWKALNSCGIEHDYITFLKKIYRDQKASVQTDEESNMFEINKGRHSASTAQTSTPAFRRNDNSDDMLRIGNMDTHQRARKNDTIDATQNAPTHHTNEKKIQKYRETESQDQRRKRHQ